VPTYEYQCDECGKRFEKFQSITEEPLDACPDCGGKVRRLLGTGAAVIFKGSGFHATDYRSTDSGTPCGRDRPCCGRETRCEKPPCSQ